jgi:hypothetical protein
VNTGKRAIETRVYDHNFLSIDHENTGPGSVVSFPFAPHATQDMGGLGEIRGKELLFPRNLQGSDTFYTELAGFGKQAADYEIRVENRRSRAGVVIRGDRPLVNLGIWAVRTVVAPEPYVEITVAPGEEARWKYTYRYYTVQNPGDSKTK